MNISGETDRFSMDLLMVCFTQGVSCYVALYEHISWGMIINFNYMSWREPVPSTGGNRCPKVLCFADGHNVCSELLQVQIY